MKQISLIGIFVLLFGAAQADEGGQAQAPAIQAHAQLISVASLPVGQDFKVSPNDYPNGVFVRVKEVFGERPVSAAIFAAMLHEHGFKIADKADEADVVVLIRSGTFNFKDIDQNTGTISAHKIDGVAGAALAALATGGISLFATDYSFLSNKRPVYASMVVYFTTTKRGEDKEQETGLTGSIKVDGTVQGTRESFVLFSNEWLKMHLHNADAGQPASAAAPEKSLADSSESTKQ
ncbi:hypothetical protein GALL_119110 [mine drainage metagenome]|uniref:Uncharacterized protein n=1 Tax=mine drainage metagenome TaxID=410659 RepID=A0A1J5SD01_9ZZZZ